MGRKLTQRTGVQRVVRRGEERHRRGKYVVIQKGKWS